MLSKEKQFYKLLEQFEWMAEQYPGNDYVARVHQIPVGDFEALVLDNMLEVYETDDKIKYFEFVPKQGIVIVGFIE